MFMGAEVKQVAEVLEQRKKQREQIDATALPHKSTTNRNSRLSELGTPPVYGTPIGDT